MLKFGSEIWSDCPDDWAHYDALETSRGCHKGGGGGGSGTTTQTVQKADPWSGQQPYLTDVFAKAQEQYNKGPMQFYQGQTYADYSPQTMQSLALQEQRATNGSPLTTASQQQLTQTMAGDYLAANNPYIANAYNAAARPVIESYQQDVLPGLDAKFSQAGRYGSGAHANMVNRATSDLGRNLTDMAGKMAYDNYSAERQNQIKGMMFAPQLAQQDYFDIAKLAEVGAANEDISQQGINEAIARWNFQQEQPWASLGNYSNLVQGFYGSQGTGATTSTMPRASIGAGMLGGAAAGGGLGYMLGGTGYGLAGAGLGGLLGAM